MSSGKYILNESGEPVAVDDTMAWGRQFEKQNRKVADTHVGESHISTVFLGLDHQFGDGPPLLWETMVFGGPLADETDRYSTCAEAEAGHAAMVERVKAVQL